MIDFTRKFPRTEDRKLATKYEGKLLEKIEVEAAVKDDQYEEDIWNSTSKKIMNENSSQEIRENLKQKLVLGIKKNGRIVKKKHRKS